MPFGRPRRADVALRQAVGAAGNGGGLASNTPPTPPASAAQNSRTGTDSVRFCFFRVPNHGLTTSGPEGAPEGSQRQAYARSRPSWRVAPLALAGAVGVTALMDVALDTLPRLSVELSEKGVIEVQLAKAGEDRRVES